jgi:hypothetical protein
VVQPQVAPHRQVAPAQEVQVQVFGVIDMRASVRMIA